MRDTLHQLALFRYELRRFLRFSEQAARAAGVTPLQHQLLLGVAGFTGSGTATVTELTEFLQERHNAVVALVNRAEKAGLVRKQRNADDRRVVHVTLTPRGGRVVVGLSRLHRRELARFRWTAALPGRRASRPRPGARRPR
jgi:DNA-binding MarR family transcriptional regulator